MKALSRMTKQALAVTTLAMTCTYAVAKVPEAQNSTQNFSTITTQLYTGMYSSQIWHTNNSIAENLDSKFQQQHNQQITTMTEQVAEQLSHSAIAAIENVTNK